jgi:Acetyl esterase (deacetylase)
MQKDISVKQYLKKITCMITARNKEVTGILNSNCEFAVKSRISELKNKYRSMLDTDLFKIRADVRRVGEVDTGGYKIEKLIMESLEGYFVPMNLYISNTSACEKKPAILVNIGHYLEGKALPEVQLMCANLALQGFIALTFDPVCQGERDLFPDYPDNRWKKDLWVVEQHMSIGNQCYLFGYNSINYFLNDAVKAIDYLCSRNDVDTNRIGVTGQSGGGTLSYLLAAFDDRIKAVAPIHCISTIDRICMNGIGDSEQSMINMVSQGFDIADFLWLIAPRPIFISAGIKDFFSIDGVRGVYNELKKLYSILEYDHNIELCEINTGHVLSREVRKSVYYFFQRVFSMNMGYYEKNVTILSHAQLSCGYISLNSRTPIDYNKLMYDCIKRQAEAVQKKWSQAEIKSELLHLLNLNRLTYRIIREKLGSHDGKDFWRILFSSDEGICFETDIRLEEKQKDSLIFIDIDESLSIYDIPEYETVNVFIIRPFGSSTDICKNKIEYDNETKLAYQSFVSGESILGLRVSQIFSLFDFIENQGFIGNKVIEGKRQGALLALFTGILDNKVSKVICRELIDSFGSFFGCKNYMINETDIIPGLLKIVDINQLVDMMGKNIFIY